MPPPRAPSLDLLRALRRTTNTISTTSHTYTCRPHRKIHTTNPLHLSSTKTHRASNQIPKPTNIPTTPATQTSESNRHNRYAPTNHDRGPTSKEDTQTDFGMMDIYANIAAPATSIDACTSEGFHLDNGVKTTNYDGLLVAGGEAWNWRPWAALQSESTQQETPKTQISILLDAKRGILTLPKQSLGLFTMLHPKPDLLIIGTGSKLWMLAAETKRYLMEELGIRVDVMDTGNASSTYNLLAKERGVEGGAGIGGAFLPLGWKGPEVKRRR